MNKARWIVILTAITALLFTGVAYAGQGGSKGNNGNNGNTYQNKGKVIEVDLTQTKNSSKNSQNENQISKRQGFGPGESAKALREQIRERNRTIKANEAQCNQLKKQIKSRCKDMKRYVQQQRSQECAELNRDQAAKIGESLEQLKEKNTQLRNERFCYKKQMAKMQSNKRAGDKAALIEDLDEIIKVQNERIQALDDTLNGLDDLEQTLK